MAKTQTGPAGARLVALDEIAPEIGGSIEHARAWVGDNNIVYDWRGRLAVPEDIAAQAVNAYRVDENERYRANLEATKERELRFEWAKARHDQLVEAKHGAERSAPRNRFWTSRVADAEIVAGKDGSELVALVEAEAAKLSVADLAKWEQERQS
jgi:hypothetical protein